MGINVRQKGASGEREIADAMNYILYQVAKELEFPEEQCLKAMSSIQRNQNQTAVGGNDLTHTLGLSIEIKRQEQLSLSTWWAQCAAAAQRHNELPVLIYRQNRKPWRVRTLVWLPLPNNRQVQVIGEFSYEEFKEWWRNWARAQLMAGAEIRS